VWYQRPVRLARFALLLLPACASAPAALLPDATVDAPIGVPDAAPDAGAPPSVELATGARAWQELPRDGSGRAEIVFGPQGGYHIFGRVRMRGLAPDVTLHFRVTSLDGTRALTDERDRIRRVSGRGLIQSAPGTWESTSGELVILQVRGPMDVMGQRWRMELQVIPADQSPVVTDTREFTIVDDEP
jgi:hypothetical protein